MLYRNLLLGGLAFGSTYAALVTELDVNFATASTPNAAGIVKDVGQLFGDRNGASYGWSCDFSASGPRSRTPSTPSDHDDYFHTLVIPDRDEICASTEWNVDVVNGVYNVEISYCDAEYGQFTDGCTIEGISASVGEVPKCTTDADGNWGEKWSGYIRVSDGKLTFAGEWGDEGGAQAQCSSITAMKFTLIPEEDQVPVTNGLLGHWTANSYSPDGGKWMDISGNNLHATPTSTSMVVKATDTETAGALGSLDYVKGPSNSGVSFPANTIPSAFTVCSLSRYTNAANTNGRIISAANPGTNWLHGHWANRKGVAHYAGWKTDTTADGSLTDWLAMCGSNSLDAESPIYANMINKRTSIGGSSYPTNYNPAQLSIGDRGTFSEDVDWGVAEIVMYNTHLSNSEILQVEQYLMEKLAAPTGAPTASPTDSPITAEALAQEELIADLEIGPWTTAKNGDTVFMCSDVCYKNENGSRDRWSYSAPGDSDHPTEAARSVNVLLETSDGKFEINLDGLKWIPDDKALTLSFPWECTCA